MRTEGLGKLIKFIGLIGSRTPDLSACSIAPQPSTLSEFISNSACFGLFSYQHGSDIPHHESDNNLP
jgi:hypothetical protein